MLILKNDQGNISCGNLVCSTLEWGYLPPKTEVLDGWLFYSESFGESNKRPCFYLVIVVGSQKKDLHTCVGTNKFRTGQNLTHAQLRCRYSIALVI